MAPPNDSQATLALVLGIVGVLCCYILGPVALYIGNSSRQRIQASGGTLGGGGLATAGMVLGIIGTIFLVFGAIAIVVAVANGLRANQ
jgi:amino acid transporter